MSTVVVTLKLISVPMSIFDDQIIELIPLIGILPVHVNLINCGLSGTGG